MAPLRIPENVVEDVRLFWSQHQKEEKSARSLYEAYKQSKGYRKLLGLRKFQQIVARAKSAAPKEPFPFVEWERWRSNSVTSEEMAYLLKLDAICTAACGRHLHRHEAIWGGRLRASLQGLSIYYQFCFVLIYALREESAYHLSSGEPYTLDLDMLVAYQPWFSDGHQRVYLKAAFSMDIPVIVISSSEEIHRLMAIAWEGTEASAEKNVRTLLPNWRIVLTWLSPLPTNLLEDDK